MKTQILKIDNDREESLRKAADFLKSGEAVAFPTETVYGLGADIFNPAACLKVFEAKMRPADSPLSAHISDIQQVETICQNIPDDFYLLYQAFMPGPISVILNAKSNVPKEVTAGGNTIGIRFPDEENCREMINLFGRPVAATSANLSGKPSPVAAEHVIDDLNGRIAAVLDAGTCRYRLESTVVLLTDEFPTILRNGVITKDAIENILNKPVVFMQADIIKKYKHYSPDKKVVVLSNIDDFYELTDAGNKIFYVLTNRNIENKTISNLYDLSEISFYERLRQADKSDCDEIIILLDDYTLANVALSERINAIAKKH